MIQQKEHTLPESILEWLELVVSNTFRYRRPKHLALQFVNHNEMKHVVNVLPDDEFPFVSGDYKYRCNRLLQTLQDVDCVRNLYELDSRVVVNETSVKYLPFIRYQRGETFEYAWVRHWFAAVYLFTSNEGDSFICGDRLLTYTAWRNMLNSVAAHLHRPEWITLALAYQSARIYQWFDQSCEAGLEPLAAITRTY